MVANLKRRWAEKGGQASALDAYFKQTPCPICHGERLTELSRTVTVNKTRLPELSALSLTALQNWIEQLDAILFGNAGIVAEAYLRDIQTKLRRLIRLGLGYLTLDRQIVTLSGGERQRLRLAAALDLEMSGLVIMLDEPTAGLHPQDTEGLIDLLKHLRDLGNTVIVIEHNLDVIKTADYIIDLGPEGGDKGGTVIATGTPEKVADNPNSYTGVYIKKMLDKQK